MIDFSELSPPYKTIVADPPWRYKTSLPGWNGKRSVVPYSTMTPDEIAAMPVTGLAATDAHLYLWTTNTFTVVRLWGFTFSTVLIWCKPVDGRMAGFPTYNGLTEYVLFCRRGSLKPKTRVDRNYFNWDRTPHSVKPAALADMVEAVSTGPYLELFARAPRLGWDSWGYGFENRPSAPPVGTQPTKGN